ncbi:MULTISPECIES: ATPase, T2SS/T4P/T4SS family [Cysteiniphilum]|uniref:P-type conjugative transfer ATPase TrbB n=1 Tax=Cysteiniphilum litorale TaxID=2056700 RepID=A0A8J2Z365_9GAMM|nr:MULTISPECIES: ATPase, T2SS/T4P/T4SS family [Cysteiniphilum]GGF93777.1 P-type conjugative transfer ATPase TrbB [Cysteiniphilum litorale]
MTNDNDIVLLKEILGNEIMSAFADENIFEIIVNSDGRLIVEDNTGKHHIADLEPVRIRNAISVICQVTNQYVSKKNSDVSLELPKIAPFNGARAQLLIPPTVKAASMTIRKHNVVSLTLHDALSSEVIDGDVFNILKEAISSYRNIIICGKAQSGKTTLVRAMLNSLKEFSNHKDRILILEETREIELDVEDKEYLQTTQGIRTMTDLASKTVRMRGNRLIVGEVRDESAYGMLQVWNTGCPGGISTLHANSPETTPQRLVDLCSPVSSQPHALIAIAVDLIVFIEHDSTVKAGRRVKKVVELVDYDSINQKFNFNTLYQSNKNNQNNQSNTTQWSQLCV